MIFSNSLSAFQALGKKVGGGVISFSPEGEFVEGRKQKKGQICGLNYPLIHSDHKCLALIFSSSGRLFWAYEWRILMNKWQSHDRLPIWRKKTFATHRLCRASKHCLRSIPISSAIIFYRTTEMKTKSMTKDTIICRSSTVMLRSACKWLLARREIAPPP